MAINSRTSHTNLALYYIKKLLKLDNDCEPTLIELTINENWKNSLEQLTVAPFDYYLFSVYIWNCNYIEEIATLIKKIHPDSKIILGGPEVTYNLTKWGNLDFVDILVKGQAEDFIPYLFTFNEKVFHSKKTPINIVPFPYGSEDINNLSGRLVYYEASRGCLFNCSYCLSSCSDQKLEYRKLDLVKKELKKLISIKPKIVKMVDRTFNSDKVYARKIWQFIIDEKSSVPFHFEVHPQFLEEADFDILKTAPFDLFHFEVGIQSTDKSILQAVNRPYNWSIEKENIRKLCSLKNVHTHLDQIVGLPMDNRTTAIESFNEILSLKPNEFQLGFLKILPGTGLSDKVEKYEMVVNSSPPYEVVQTSTMNFTEIKEFYKIETELNRFYNSHYFVKTVGFLLANCRDSWTFFSRLQEFSPLDRSVKQWARLGESLLHYIEKYHSQEREYLFDLLRLDWCPFASGQNYPPFLRRNDGELIKIKRKSAYAALSEQIEDFTRRDFNHSILYLPKNEKMIEELENKALLFYRSESVKEYTIDLDLF